jgi:cysteine-S-conjugate beta-lyase
LKLFLRRFGELSDALKFLQKQIEMPERVKRKFRLATECVFVDSTLSIQSGDSNSQQQQHFNASSIPIYQTATFKQSSATQMGEYDYSRSGNPTRSHVENHLAKLMSAYQAFVVSSGMSALDVMTRLVKTGEEIIAGNDLYGGIHSLT